MPKERRTFVARLSPADHDAIMARARDEVRSLGETIALILLENQLLRDAAQEGTDGN